MTDQTFTLSTGRKLGYSEYGDPDGVPLFYYHGWPSSRSQGSLVDTAGKELGLRVIAPDRPGIGLSDFQPHRQLLDWPPVLAELADHLGADQFHVMGVSGGGPYVLATAHAFPERTLSASVLCGAPPLKEVGTDELLWTYKVALWSQRHVPLLLAPGLAISASILRLSPSSRSVQSYVKKFCQRDQDALNDPESARAIFGSGRVGLESGARAVTTDGNIYSADWGIELEKVSYPIQYWHGAQDLNIPTSMVSRFVQRMPKAQLTVLEGEGHYSLPILCVADILKKVAGARQPVAA